MSLVYRQRGIYCLISGAFGNHIWETTTQRRAMLTEAERWRSSAWSCQASLQRATHSIKDGETDLPTPEVWQRDGTQGGPDPPPGSKTCIFLTSLSYRLEQPLQTPTSATTPSANRDNRKVNENNNNDNKTVTTTTCFSHINRVC